jgi:hypothetical protein
MTTSTTYAGVKQQKVREHQKYLSTAFKETASSGIDVSDTRNHVVTSGDSVTTSATLRIGQVTLHRKANTFNIITEDTTLGVKQVGPATILGSDESMHSLDDFKQGHNVKHLNETRCSMLPHMTINSDYIVDSRGFVNNFYSETTFGQLYSYYFENVQNGIDKKFIPFFDYEGILDPVHYIRIGGYYRGYMIINNNVTDYLHYIEPDSIIHDGAIDVFQVRSQKGNTDIQDIQTRGIRADLSPGSWELPAHSVTELKKGTSIIDSKFEIKQAEHDFFEDCQDLVFANSQFSKTKTGITAETPTSGYRYSLDGYVSEGHYMSNPFKDATPLDNAFRNVNFAHQFNSNLRNIITTTTGSRNTSEIGLRFKSAGNGGILRPKYDSVVQTVLGVDSITFAGRMRE